MSTRKNLGQVVSPTLHVSVFFTITVFVAIVIMSYLFKVEIVAKGIGKVVPLGRVQVIQPELGGQIAAIHIQNGSEVTQGQLLIELDSTNVQTEVNRLMAEKYRLQSEGQRIKRIMSLLPRAKEISEGMIKEIVADFRTGTSSQNNYYHEEQANLLAAELRELSDIFAQIDIRIDANRKSEDVTRAGIARIDNAIEAQQERLSIARSLLDKGTTSKRGYLDVLEDFTRLGKDREILERELVQKSTQEAAYLNEKLGVISHLRSTMLNRKVALETRLFEVDGHLVVSQRRVKGMKVLSPVDGVITQLSVQTIGGVVSTGQELMRVVPKDQSYEIEAIFPNIDIGFLATGQSVNIKLDAFPAERFGSLKGTITNISADAVEVEKGVFGFVVRIRPDTPYLKTPIHQHPLHPGMTSIVGAITGERRIITYFLAPIVKVVGESLGER